MKYDWTQTKKSIIINFPEITTKPTISFENDILTINNEQKTMKDEVKDFNWYIDDHLIVEFEKIKSEMWEELFVGEKVEPENVYAEDMDDETKAMVEKMMYEQKIKQGNGKSGVEEMMENESSDQNDYEEIKEEGDKE